MSGFGVSLAHVLASRPTDVCRRVAETTFYFRGTHMASADRRQATRFEFVGDQLGSVHGLEPLRVRNLGRDGLLIESVAPIAVGSVLGLHMIHGTASAQIQAAVRHQSPASHSGNGEQYLVGLEFINLDEDARGWIDEVLDAQSKPATLGEA